MTVRMVSLKVSESVGITGEYWEDNFADTPGRTLALIQQNYFHLQQSQPALFGQNDVPILGANNGLAFQQGTVAANSCYGHWIPMQIFGAGNVSQFSECVILADSGAARGGLCVLVSGGDQRALSQRNSYIAEWGRNVPTIFIGQVLNATQTTLASTAAIPAVGSKVTFTCDLDTMPGSAILKLFDDDVEILSFTDATPFTVGYPGFFTRGSPVAGQSVEFGNFRCGILSRL